MNEEQPSCDLHRATQKISWWKHIKDDNSSLFSPSYQD